VATSRFPHKTGIVALSAAMLLVTACSDSSDSGKPEMPPEPIPLENPYAGFTSDTYSGPDNWLCHDELPAAENACLNGVKDQDVSVVSADGGTTIEPFEPAQEPPVDCFYVYPTVSLDESVNSDFDATLNEPLVASIQAARYSTHCRVFAPIYRQVTLAGIAPSDAAGDIDLGEAGELAYGDVLEAFRHFIANQGDGRGYVLIGHSQGSAHLLNLLQTEIENNEYLLDHLIAAHLIGIPIQVPEGADVGGDLNTVPLCRSATETACLINYSSYRRGDAAIAEGNAFFGQPRDDLFAACVNPAALSGGEAELDAYFAVSSLPSFESVLVPRATGPYADPDAFPPLQTGFYRMPGLISGQCRRAENGISYLEVWTNADPDDPRADDFNGEMLILPSWGLHLVDMNLTTGNLIALAGSQSQAWLEDR
jgi:hypothetical protein